MFRYLMRVSSKDSLRQINELARVIFQSDVTGTIGVESSREILEALTRIPGVSDVRPERSTGRLMVMTR